MRPSPRPVGLILGVVNQRIHRSSSTPRTQEKSSRFAPRPFAVQAKSAPKGAAPARQEEQRPSPVSQPAEREPAIDRPIQRQDSPDVIQAKLGFEFETGWLVWKRVIDPSNDEDTGMIDVPLHKKDPVGTGAYPGFNVEADEAHAGNSEIEFVVHPPVPETEEGFEQLDQTMQALYRYCQDLLAHKGRQSFRLHEATGLGGDSSYTVAPDQGKGNNLEAGAQVTLGLALENIPRFLLDASGNRHVELEDSDLPPKQRGLFTLIASYLTTGIGNSPVNYPKRIAEPLLARTNFVRLFGLMEPGRQEYYLGHREEWIADILAFAELPAEQADRDVIDRGIVDDDSTEHHTELRQELGRLRFDLRNLDTDLEADDDEVRQLRQAGAAIEPDTWDKLVKNQHFKNYTRLQVLLAQRPRTLQEKLRVFQEIHRVSTEKNDLERFTGLTVRQWLLGILDGQDRLSQIQDAESMGALNRTEGVGPEEQKQGGIFEYRGDQKKKIPPGEWRDYALNYLKHVAGLNAK